MREGGRGDEGGIEAGVALRLVFEGGEGETEKEGGGAVVVHEEGGGLLLLCVFGRS